MLRKAITRYLAAWHLMNPKHEHPIHPGSVSSLIDQGKIRELASDFDDQWWPPMLDAKLL